MNRAQGSNPTSTEGLDDIFQPVGIDNVLHNLAWNGTYTDVDQTVISDVAIKKAKAAIDRYASTVAKREVVKALEQVAIDVTDAALNEMLARRIVALKARQTDQGEAVGDAQEGTQNE